MTSTEIDLIMTRFYKEIKKARQSALLTQAQVAKALGVTFQQYQKYESGANRMHLERIILFCKFLNIDIGDILNQCIYPDKDPDKELHSASQERLWLGIIDKLEKTIEELRLQMQKIREVVQ